MNTQVSINLTIIYDLDIDKTDLSRLIVKDITDEIKNEKEIYGFTKAIVHSVEII